MKCPILVSNLTPAERTPVQAGECLRENCEWWEPTLAICSRRVLASLAVNQQVDRLSTSLAKLKEKLKEGKK